MAITLSNASERSGYAIALEFYNNVKTAGDQVQALCNLIDTSAFYIGDDELNETAKVHPSISLTWELMGHALEKLCQRNLLEEEFYAELWKFISNSGLFSDDEDKISAVFCMLVNPRIPYKFFNMPSMSQDEFDRRRAKLQPEIRMLVQVARRSFPQRTQEALAALSVIEGLGSEEDRAVAMATFLSNIRGITAPR